MKKLALTAGAAACLTVAASMSGCGTNPNDVSLGAITADMSPEVMTLNQRPEDVWRHMAYTNNVHMREFWEDLGRFWYTDHPSRLNPIEIVSVSGKPH